MLTLTHVFTRMEKALPSYLDAFRVCSIRTPPPPATTELSSISNDLKLDAQRDLRDVGCHVSVIDGCQVILAPLLFV